MSLREQGKQKVQRIDLGHFRHRTWLTWTRWLSSAAAFLLSVAYVGWVWTLDQPSAAPSNAKTQQLSTGPLSQVHASFENNCQKCHASDFGIGLSPDSVQLDQSARLDLQAQKCGECHIQARDLSHWHFRDSLANTDKDRDCAHCHQDHQGRTFAMTEVADATCTQCHQNLDAACRAGFKSKLKTSVGDFSVNSHGEVFRSLGQDTGRIKFNHAEHMLPGQVSAEHRGAFEAKWLPKGKEERYGHVNRNGVEVVKLICTDCHEPLKINNPARTSGVASEEGRFYAPVSFEKHCADCHQMTFAGQTSDNLPLPHYASTDEFNRLLSFNSRADRLKGQVSMQADRALDAEDRQALPDTNRPVELDQVGIANAVQSMQKRCLQCHMPEDVTTAAIDQANAGKKQPLIPDRWLQFGFFDHAAHSSIKNCQYCHPGTYARDTITDQKVKELQAANPGSLSTAVDHQIVKINSISSCLPCHLASGLADDSSLDSPEKRKAVLGVANQPIRASNACTLCHRYHWTRPALPQSSPPSPDAQDQQATQQASLEAPTPAVSQVTP